MLVKLCKDCEWSKQERPDYLELYCLNPLVNAKDPYALSRVNFYGSSCLVEREKQYFGTCGMNGKLWKQKEELQESAEEVVKKSKELQEISDRWAEIMKQSFSWNKNGSN